MRGLAALLLFLPAAVSAEVPIVTSHAPDTVGVTIYRNNLRSADSFIRDWENGGADYDEGELPQGFAVIDEVRTIELPPGQATVRFEGVASGIVPQSAILFDNDLSEKNFDARLLSERGLIDAFTGQSVTIRRTDPATGAVRTERGTILSYPDALILHTSAGYEAIRCEGNHSSLLFPGVPVDLTAKPTLSMTTRPDQPGGKMTLHLAYLAANFDWNATYVGTFSPDAGTLRLAGWLTLESADQTSFADADTSAVAGTVFRAYPTEEEQEAEQEAREDDPYAPDNIEVGASCWPSGRTSGANQYLPGGLGAPIEVALNQLPQFNVSQSSLYAEDAEIVVTGSRIIAPSTIGDLKFYRLPHRTTVAAQSQKQVRFLSEQEVKGETLFLAEVRNEYADDGKLVFRFKNEKRNGLGVPLPLGGVTLFQETRLGRQLIGPASIRDKAIGEDVEIPVANDASDEGVYIDVDRVDDPKVAKDDQSRQELTVENFNEYPVTVEVELYDTDEYRISNPSERIFKRDGARVWRVVLKPEEERKMRFTSTEVPEPDWEDY